MVQFAKAITSGYFPLGGVGVSESIAETIEQSESPWMHAYTYSSHPVGCAVALCNLRILEREGLPAQAAEKGDYLLAGLRAELSDHPHVGDIRGKGLMCAVEFVQDRSTKAEFETAARVGEKIHAEAQARGLFQQAARRRFSAWHRRSSSRASSWIARSESYRSPLERFSARTVLGIPPGKRLALPRVAA